MRVTFVQPFAPERYRPVLLRVLEAGGAVSAVFPAGTPTEVVLAHLRGEGRGDALVVGHGVEGRDGVALAAELFRALGAPRRTVVVVGDAPLGALNTELSRALGPARREVLPLPLHQFETANIAGNLAYHLGDALAPEDAHG